MNEICFYLIIFVVLTIVVFVLCVIQVVGFYPVHIIIATRKIFNSCSSDDKYSNKNNTKVKNIDTKQPNKRNNQNPKSK